MNLYAIKAIYLFELARTWRTLLQSIATPVISTSLYFVVFGSAIGSSMTEVHGVSYGAFIVPGLILLALLTESIGNASFGIYMPKYSGTIYEILSAPVSYFEILVGYVGAAATKSVILGLIILATARLFVDFSILHPFWMIGFLVLTSVAFSLLGFVIGVWADGWEKLQIVPMMKPNRQKVMAVSTSSASAQNGWASSKSTNSIEVKKMIKPRITDLVAAAPT